jgi:tRNA(Phe) wybutosine-synthesizing methylase Tyw3
MGSDSLDLEAFLDEMVSLINEKFKKQEKRIRDLKKEIEELRKSTENKGKIQIDKKVLRVLSGK